MVRRRKIKKRFVACFFLYKEGDGCLELATRGSGGRRYDGCIEVACRQPHE